MKIKNLFKDDNAVSPVIGVILMVAITVILAAVIASFVLGLGDSADNVQPNTSFEFDYSSSAPAVDVVVSDGDAVEAQELITRGQNIGTNGDAFSDFASGDTIGVSGAFSGTDEVSAGQGVNVSVSGDAYQLDIVWENFDGDESATLASDKGPDA